MDPGPPIRERDVMTQSHLRPCPSCARHVRVSEGGCPFCGESLSDAFRAAPRPQGPGARLGRAALFAFGTGTLTLASACSSSSDTPLYGVPPGTAPIALDAGDDGETTASDGAVGPDASAEPDAPGVTPVYGSPVQPVEPTDASDDHHVGVTPLYGIAPGH
jgi:hypothetical protein